MTYRGFPGGPAVRTQSFHCCAWVLSLVGELRSSKPYSVPVPQNVYDIQLSSVAQSCPTLCDPTDCSTPASLSITSSRSSLKLMSIASVMPSAVSPPVVPFSFHLQSFAASGSFQMSQFFPSGGQSTGVSASASVLPMNIQD